MQNQSGELLLLMDLLMLHCNTGSSSLKCSQMLLYQIDLFMCQEHQSSYLVAGQPRFRVGSPLMQLNSVYFHLFTLFALFHWPMKSEKLKQLCIVPVNFNLQFLHNKVMYKDSITIYLFSESLNLQTYFSTVITMVAKV